MTLRIVDRREELSRDSTRGQMRDAIDEALGMSSPASES
jgi:hypothetical protein